MRNVRITPEPRQAVILDLELAWQIDDPGDPYFQGTPGFVSPQQLDQQRPAFSDDVYALGAVIACTLTGCDPQRLGYANPSDRSTQISSLSGAPSDLCAIAGACLSEDPKHRPVRAPRVRS